jgi:hypothetical protein
VISTPSRAIFVFSGTLPRRLLRLLGAALSMPLHCRCPALAAALTYALNALCLNLVNTSDSIVGTAAAQHAACGRVDAVRECNSVCHGNRKFYLEKNSAWVAFLLATS